MDAHVAPWILQTFENAILAEQRAQNVPAHGRHYTFNH